MTAARADLKAIGWAYWQRGRWYSIDCEPVVIELRDARLSLRTEARWVAEVPVASVSARYTRLGSLCLSLAGAEFVLLDYGGRASRAPSRAFVEPIRRSTGQEVRSVSGWQSILRAAGIVVKGNRKSASIVLSAAIVVGLAAIGTLVVAVTLAFGR